MLILDSTQAKTFSKCPRSYKYNYVDMLKPIEQEVNTLDLRWGEAIHAALELFEPNKDCLEAMKEQFVKNFLQLPDDNNERNALIKTTEHAFIVLEEFIKYYALNFSGWETLSIEQLGELNIDDKIKYLCKIDKVVRWNGCIYPVDYKAQPLDSLILTNVGWKKMEDMILGSFVIGSDGKPTLVTGVYPQGIKECYEIKFSDGAKVECSKEHLWTVINQYGTGNPQTLTLEKIIEKRNQKIGTSNYHYNFRVPIVKPIQYVSNPVSINPYLMGVLLGNGCITGHIVGISIGKQYEKEMVKNINNNIPKGMQLKKCKGNNFSWILKNLKDKNCNPLIRELKELNLMGKYSYTKFIPKQYFTASVEDRLSLLQGLMDTDGCCYKGYLMYDSTSYELASGVIDIIRSLGGIARVRQVKGNKRPAYRVNFRLDDITPFKLSNKIKKLRALKIKPSRYIKSINKIGEKEMQCISVAAKDGLYVTNDYIVTHNTTASKKTYNFFDKFDLDVQASGYISWCKKKYGECGGFIPLVMFVGYRSRKYKDEPAGFHVRFDYTIVNQTNEVLEDFKLDMLRTYSEIELSKKTYFKKSPTACEYWGCKYKPLCTSVEDQCVMESMYTTYDANKYLNRSA